MPATKDHREDYASPSHLTGVGGWLLVTAMVYAPWAFGSRPYWAMEILAGVLSGAGASWLGGCLRERCLPRLPLACGGAVLFLAGCAGVALLNPQSVYDTAHRAFLPNPAYVSWLPTTVDVRNAAISTAGLLAVLLVVPMAADLSRQPCWRERFLRTIALTGFSVALAGLCLKTGLLPQVSDYLAHRAWAQGECFGPFDYHGNAGAFLNLVLPAAAATALGTIAPGRRVCWHGAVGVLYIALFINSSRAALVIGLLLFPICLWLMTRGSRTPGPPPRRTVRRWRLGAGILAGVLTVIAILLVNHDSVPIRRLRKLPHELHQSDYPRYLQSRAAWEMARERPLFGAGVGAYRLLVQDSSIRGYFFAPYFRPGDPFTVLGHTHEDYLETLVEWGWIGFGAWAFLVGGALVKLGQLLRRTQGKSRTGLAIGTALLAVYLHALGDCPLQIPALQLYVAVYLGLAWGSPRWWSDGSPGSAPLRTPEERSGPACVATPPGPASEPGFSPPPMTGPAAG